MTESKRRISDPDVDRSEGFGERLLGVLLDREHTMPPHMVAPLIAEEVNRMGGREVSILLQCYEQVVLVPLPGRGLTVGEPEPVDGSAAGESFLCAKTVEVRQADGVRMYLSLLDGSDQVGVLAVTLDTVDDDDRRLLRRLASLVADIIVTKDSFTDQFFRARRRAPMSVAAEVQWSLLPPLTMTTPLVAVAGILEPAYGIAGDSFDYALNDDILHAAVIDAMGHDLGAAAMATMAVGAYRHARRAGIGLSELYTSMDRIVAEQFGAEEFVTAQMLRLEVETGTLQWVNAGHPAPILIREREVVQRLEGPTTLPVGVGGDEPQVNEVTLQRGDRVLCFSDGLVEEHEPGAEQFGEERLLACVNRVARVARDEEGVRGVVRSLSHTLKKERGGNTSDDATLFLIEWSGGAADHLVTL